MQYILMKYNINCMWHNNGLLTEDIIELYRKNRYPTSFVVFHKVCLG
jgi:hypothetical protein